MAQEELDALQRQVDELLPIKAQYAALRKKYRHLEEEMQVLQHSAMAEDTATEKRGSRREESLKQQLAHLKAEHEDQFSKVMDLEFRIEVLSSQVSELTKERDEARTALQAATADGTAAAQEAATLRDKARDAQAALADRDARIAVLEDAVQAAKDAAAAAAAAGGQAPGSSKGSSLSESASVVGDLSSVDGASDAAVDPQAKLKRMFKALKVEFVKKKKKLIQVLDLHKQLKIEFKKKRDQNEKLKKMYIANRDKLKALAAKHLALKKAYRAATASGSQAGTESADLDHSTASVTHPTAAASTELVHKLKQRVIALKQKVKSLDAQKRQLERRLAEATYAHMDASPQPIAPGAAAGSSDMQTSRLLKEKLLKQQSIRRRLERDVEFLKSSSTTVSSGPRALGPHLRNIRASAASPNRSSTLSTADMLPASVMARATLSPATATSAAAPPQSIADRRMNKVTGGRKRRNSISLM